MKDILVAGHHSHDILSMNNMSRRALGGPPAYIASTLVPLGADFHVVSKVGKDFRYFQELQALGSEKPIISGKKTTTLFHDYSGKERKSALLAKCSPIYPKDIKTKQKAAIVAGHVGEVLPETVEKMKKKSGIVLADIQAFIRSTQKDKSIYHVNIRDTPFYDILDSIDFLKASESEARFIGRDAMEKTNLIITQGEKGCIIHSDGKKIVIKGEKVNVVDPTGAGDVFLGAFSYGMVKEQDMKRCAELANRCAALAVAQPGVPRLSEKDVKFSI